MDHRTNIHTSCFNGGRKLIWNEFWGNVAVPDISRYGWAPVYQLLEEERVQYRYGQFPKMAIQLLPCFRWMEV